MGFLNREHSNIDPFNAGEPVMPWDDPQTSQGEQENPIFTTESADASGDCGYHAPTKEQDGYEPVMHEAEHDQAFAAEPKRKRAGKSKSESKRVRTKRVVVTTSASTPGKGKVGPKKLILGLVIGAVALSVLLSAIGAAVDIVEDVVSDIFDSDSTSYSSSYSASSSATYDEEDEQELTKQAQAKLDAALEDTASMDARYRKVLNERLKISLGLTADEAGLDTDAFCTWMRERSTMEISSVFCYDEGTVYLGSSYPALYKLNDVFGDKAFKYLNKQGIDPYSSTGERKLTDEQKEHVNKLFLEGLEKLTQTTSGSARVEADKGGDAWEIDDDDFAEALDQLLGHYDD